MARLIFPDEGSRLTYRMVGSGKPFLSAAGGTARIYADAAGSTLADIQTVQGVTIQGSTLTVTAASQLPLFKGPDGADTVWASVDGGPLAPVYARADDRLDAVENGTASLTGVVRSVNGVLPNTTTGNVTLAAGAVSDAGSVVKGVLRLTGDLAGTADAPTTPTALHKTGAETAAGVKTFNDGIVIPDANLPISKVNGLQAALDARATKDDLTALGAKVDAASSVSLAEVKLSRVSPTASWQNNAGVTYDQVAIAALRPRPIAWFCPEGSEPQWSSNDWDANVAYHDEVRTYDPAVIVPTGDTTAPSAPTALSSPSKTDTSITVTATPATDNVGVARYRLEALQGTTVIQFAESPTLPVTVSALAANTAYTLRMFAIDAAGNVGPASATISVTTTGSTTAAPVVTLVSKTSTTATHSWTTSAPNVRVGWTASPHNTPAASWFDTNLKGGTGQFTSTNLTPNSPYVLYAENVVGGSTGARGSVSITTDAATTPPPAGNTTGNLPTKIVATWVYQWEGPTLDALLDLPVASRPNFYQAAIAQGTGNGGNITFNGFGRITPAMVARAKTMGYHVTLTIGGGGGDGGIQLLNSTNVTQMVDSIKALVTQFGFTGVDWDIESAGWNVASMLSASQQLRAFYGPTFVISYAPRPFEFRTSGGAAYQFLMQAHQAGVLDVFFGQWYDFTEMKDDTALRNFFLNDTAALRQAGFPASKIGLGAITYSGYSLGWNDPQAYVSAFKALEATQPALRGICTWSSSLEQAGGYAAWPIFNSAVRGVT